MSAPEIQRASIFATTRWTMVLQADGWILLRLADALARLCRIYWYPLYAYVRRLDPF
jgi:RNA polymerase sigma-70 factor (ECF subfamily)